MALLLYTIVYIAVTVAANMLATTLITLPLVGVVAAGTLFFGATFTLRDWVHTYAHEHGLGRKPIYLMIVSAAVVNTIVALVSGGDAFNIRVVGASCLAILLAEGADTEVYQRLIERSWFIRIGASNAVSAPLDSIIFTMVAFYGASFFPQELIVPVIVGDTLLKYLIGALLASLKAGRDGLKHYLLEDFAS